jgi:TonB family protein
MSDRKPCVRCGRTIDGYARICPYCNWDQTAPVPAAAPQPVATNYVPPEETKLRKYVLGGVGGVVMVIVLFFIGSHVHGKNPPPVTSTEQAPAPSGPATSQQRSNVTLIPDTSPAPPAPGQAITSAPVSDTAQGLSSQTDRTDATAVSSAEYTQMAQRAAAEAARKDKMAGVVDPLTIQGNAYGNPAPHSMTSSSTVSARRVVRTPAVAEYRPMPDLGVRDNATARLELTIGPDGRVRAINVLQPLPGRTPQLLQAVQAWRFKPATQNGTPVASTFTTAITFHAR